MSIFRSRTQAAQQAAIRQERTRQEAAIQEAARAEAASAEAARVTAEEPAGQESRANLAKLISPTSSGEAWSVLGAEKMLDEINQRVRQITGGLNLSQISEKSFPVKVPATIYTAYEGDEYTGRNVTYAYYTRPGMQRPEVYAINPSDIKGLNATYAGKISNPNQGSDWQTVDSYSVELPIGTVKRLVNKQTGEIIPGSPEGKTTSLRLRSGMSNENYTKPDEYDLGGWDFKDLTYASLTFDANGNPQIKTWGKTSNNAAEYLAPISIALMAVPGLGQAVGSALLPTGVSAATATAVGNAVVNAGLQVASGVPVEKAILNSAATLGVSQLVPNLSGNVYVDNAVRSVATAALTGGDVGNALANSLIATGGNELLGNASFTGDKVVDSAIASAITSGVQAAATDGDVGASIIRGGISGASGQIDKEQKAEEIAKSGAGFIGEDVTAPINVAGDIGKDTVTIPPSGNTVVVIEVDKNSNEALVIDEVGNTSVVSATDSATGNSVNSGEIVTLTPDNSLTTGQETVATGIADDMASGGFVDTAPVVTAPVDTGVTDTGAVDTTQVATSDEAPSTNINQGITEPANVAEPGIDPRILAQGVAGGQFGEGGLLQTGGNIGVNVLPPNPQSEFGVQKNINARADFNESSLGAKYGEINSPHWGKLISSIMINDVVDSNGNPIDTPVGYYAIYDPDTKSTFYEFSLSDGTTVTSKTRPFVEQGKIFSEDKFFELKPSRQPSELNINTGAGNGAFLGGTEDLVEEPVPGITISASKPIIDQRLLDLVEQAPDQESATNATVAYYQALDNDLSDDEALNAAKTAMQAKSPEILFDDSIVEQQPTEQQVADTGLTVVGQPVNQTPVVSPTTPSVTPPTIAPVVTEPVVTQPVVPEPVVTQPPVTEPVVTEPVVTEPPITQPITQPVVTQPVTQQPTTTDIVTTAPSTTPPVTQPVEQTPSVEPLPPPPTVEPTPPKSEVTGIVLQNNGDGTALVLTNDGNATNVPVTDAVSNEQLTPGASVTVDQNTNTATITPPVTEVVTPEPVAPVPPTVQDTGNQQVIGGGQEPTTDAGTVINTPIGPDTYTPPTPEPVVTEPPPPPPPPPELPTTPQEPIPEPPQEPVVDKTEEDLLLEQIIQELEAKPPVSEGVPIQEPEFPEPPLVLPESPTINVADRLTIRPVVDRGYRRPSVSPGSRVEESAQILPLRPGLSEGGTGGIEGTTEQEQEPVWNVRSLKLRRLLGI